MGTNSVIAAKIKGAYKLGQFFKYDGGDNEKIIIKLFEKYGEHDIFTALEKLEWLTTTDTEEYAKRLGVQYEKEKDYFPNWNEFEHFRSCYPQYDHTARTDRLLNYIMDGTIKKVPDYTKALEAKDVDFQYIMNFDTGKIEVYKFGEFREAIPFPEKKTPELVGITVRYSNGNTKEIQSGCCVDLEEGSDDLSVEMLNVKPFDLVRLAYGLVAAVQRLGMREELTQYVNGVTETESNEEC